MRERFTKYLFGSDVWLLDIDMESDFSDAVKADKIDRIEEMLEDTSIPIRERHIIEAVQVAIMYNRVRILEFLLSHDKVKKCFKKHQNIKTYRKETGDWGIAGKAVSFITSSVASVHSNLFPSSTPISYSNILTCALEPYVEFGARPQVKIIDIILKSDLFAEIFDINQKWCEVKTETTRHRESHFSSYKPDKEWSETKSIIITKTPIYMACETGNIPLVKRILQEENLDIHAKSSYSEVVSTTRFVYSGSSKILKREEYTPLEMVRQKGFNGIANLLTTYKPTYNPARGRRVGLYTLLAFKQKEEDAKNMPVQPQEKEDLFVEDKTDIKPSRPALSGSHYSGASSASTTTAASTSAITSKPTKQEWEDSPTSTPYTPAFFVGEKSESVAEVKREAQKVGDEQDNDTFEKEKDKYEMDDGDLLDDTSSDDDHIWEISAKEREKLKDAIDKHVRAGGTVMIIGGEFPKSFAREKASSSSGEVTTTTLCKNKI